MKRLVVLAPGIRGFRGWTPLVDRLKKEEAFQEAHWLWWDHGKRWYSGGHPDALAKDLRASIDQEWAARGPFHDIVMVGHSMSGLLVRMAYLRGCGADHDSRQPSPWGTKVSRIILFAGLSRGIDAKRSVWLRLGQWLGRFFVHPRLRRLGWHLYRGSSTITNLRIQWIRHMATLGADAPIVCQIVGTKDGLVSREDSLDVEHFQTGYYIEIPGANHGDLHKLDKAPDADGRYALIRDAFLKGVPENAQQVPSEPPPDRVVFVLHGIRANNKTWVRDTVSQINANWPGVSAIPLGYPYFSAAKFAIPTTRRKHLRWFQDEYTEALCENPLAKFSFIGHSNGTYLFGQSLQAIPGMKFDRAVLVGSVLPQDYDWDEVHRRGQIESIRFDGSNFDWPVGWLCSALRAVGMKDIGTGGFEGFTRCNRPEKHEFFWYNGGHSEPLANANLPSLASFAVAGTVQPPAALGKESMWFATVSRAMRYFGPLLLSLGIIITIGIGIVFSVWHAVLLMLGLLLLVVILDIV